MNTKSKIDRAEWRRPRTVSLTPDQERYITETLGENANVSAYMRQLVDAAREGRVNFGPKKEGETSAMDRARAYHKAKEAGMNFEEDVGRVLDTLFKKDKSVRVVKNRIHNGDSVFVADFSIERVDGTVLLSVVCKSSPRADRLNLALAEAMIGTQKTKAPVLSVVPYLLTESDEVTAKFGMLGYKIARLSELETTVAGMLPQKK